MSAPPVVADGLCKAFRAPDSGGGHVVAVDHASFTARRGAFTVITGASGSGKSTLLQLLAGLERPDRGSVTIGETEITALGERRLAAFRRRRIGFVFQSYNLLPNLTARANIELPLHLDGRRADRHRVDELAASLGIADRLSHRPAQLSGGQQQRVAVARALLTRPEVVFADEPTGALDEPTADQLLQVLLSAAHDHDQAVVVVTHDSKVAAQADDVYTMDTGRLTQLVPVQ